MSDDAQPHAEGLAPGRARRAAASSRPTTCPASAPTCRSSRCSTSLNDRLIDDGEEPIAFEHDCREGICGSCSMMINGQAHGPQRGTATCQLHMRKFQRRRRHHRRAVAGRGVPDHQGPRRRPLGVRPHRRGGRLHHAPTPAPRPTANLIPVPKEPPTPRWTPPRASAAARAWPRARTAPRSCSPSAKVAAPQPAAAGPARALRARRGDGRHDGGVLRLLHQPRRVRGGVPEGDLHRLHRADEPRLREGEVQEPAHRPADLAWPRPSRVARRRPRSARPGCVAALPLPWMPPSIRSTSPTPSPAGRPGELGEPGDAGGRRASCGTSSRGSRARRRQKPATPTCRRTRSAWRSGASPICSPASATSSRPTATSRRRRRRTAPPGRARRPARRAPRPHRAAPRPDPEPARARRSSCAGSLGEKEADAVAWVDGLDPDARRTFVDEVDRTTGPAARRLAGVRAALVGADPGAGPGRASPTARWCSPVGPTSCSAVRPTPWPALVIEVKSGAFGIDERDDGLVYALLLALRDGAAPAAAITATRRCHRRGPARGGRRAEQRSPPRRAGDRRPPPDRGGPDRRRDRPRR